MEIWWDRMQERIEETILAYKENRKPDIIRYAIHITSNCNLSCPYCKESKKGKYMDRELFKKLCYKAGSKGVVHITGGEPMTVPYLEEEIYNLRGITRFTLNTNMLILPKRDALKSLFKIKTSLDTYRPQSSIIMDNIKQVSKVVSNISICYTATHENINQLTDFIIHQKKELPFISLMSVSFYKGHNKKLILTQDDISRLFDMAENLDDASKKVFTETHSKEGNFFPENLRIPCYLSMTERLYDENGDEYYCSHLFRDKVSAPGHPGKDGHCVTGCNKRFAEYNKEIHGRIK